MGLKMQKTAQVVKSESPGFESWLAFLANSVFLDKQFGFSKVHFPYLYNADNTLCPVGPWWVWRGSSISNADTIPTNGGRYCH